MRKGQVPAETGPRSRAGDGETTGRPAGGEIVGYGILVRHRGFVDRMLPAEGYAYYPPGNINHWLAGPEREAMCLRTEEEARALADELTAKFGAEHYRFTVAVRRLAPRWFILNPARESESVPIGSREQIL
jgi:hypothetical protein